MKTVFCFIFVFNLFTASVFAGTRDDSYLGIRAYSNSEVLQIHMIVTDPLGRKNGYTLLPFPHDIYEFQGGYAEEFPMGDEVALEPAGYASISFNHGPVTKGTYTITFCGISDTPVFYEMETHDSDNVFNMPDGKLYTFDGYISSGSVVEYKTYLDPTPGAPAPTIIKEVTFQLLRDDVNVAYKLNQIGDDKFVDSLTRMINLAEKLSIKCDKPKGHDKGHNKKETCKPAIAILN
ncbi:MAG: hypothetical protein L6420_00790, partial [Elusimicrobia bacterium]|nr:hypothetical protein [Elusimicrobiota bacterium]